MMWISAVVAQESTPAESYDVHEAYQVYSVLLPHEESSGVAKSTLVIQQDTVPQRVSGACLTVEATNKFKDAIADFEHVNSKRWLLQRHFQIERRYELVREYTIRRLFKGPGEWDGFHKRYPGSVAYVTMSAVGFNKEKTQAIVCIGCSCGALCGRWSFHLMEKLDGKWQEVPGVQCMP